MIVAGVPIARNSTLDFLHLIGATAPTAEQRWTVNDMVLYDYVFGKRIGQMISDANERQDKIVAVTLQNGIYTMIVEVRGNKMDGGKNDAQ